MGKYLRKQLQTSQFLLEHHSYSDFYLSCWQTSRCPLPLLCFRAVIFLGCLAILLASFILTAKSESVAIGYWFIFMTHWGLVVNTAASGFGVLVSLRAYIEKPAESYQSLPWFAKAFWASYNIAMVIAFLVSIYYFAVLVPMYTEDLQLAVNKVLDLFIHAINSVLMFFLLLSSRLPARLLHFVYPLGFGIIYLLFSVIYYFAGGTDPFGNKYIYPTLDWGKAAKSGVMLVPTALFLVILHGLVVLIAASRNWLARRIGGRKSSSLDIPYS
ncbi:hypothetical protein O0L34_g9891 [Tuta absoluta]|nr:hypothetical protein O0L34_g9891 [Tuta absoluta]